MRVKTQYAFLNKFAKSNGIVLLGSTTLDELPVNELLQNFNVSKNIYNRSISGLTISEAEQYLEQCVFALCPGKVIINLGEEDLLLSDNISQLIEQYRWLLYKIHVALPSCRLVLTGIKGKGEIYNIFNAEVKKLANEFGCTFYDIPEVENEEEYGPMFLRTIKLSLYEDNLSRSELASRAILGLMMP